MRYGIQLINFKMVKRRQDNNNCRITSFYSQVSIANSNTINKNKPLLMSPDQVDRCNDILKARKSAISRGKDPAEAEQRIRKKYEKKACLKNKISNYFEARASPA